MRILYIDPSLRQNLGHHANACVNITLAMRRAGHEVEILANQRLERDLPIVAKPVFRRDIYYHISLHPYRRSGADLVVASYAIGAMREIERFRPDVIYAHSINGLALEAFAKAVDAIYAPGKAPWLIAELPFPTTAMRQRRDGYYFVEQIKRAQDNIRAMGLKHVKLITVDDITSTELQQAIGFPVATFPSPYVVQRQEIARSAKIDHSIVVGCVGHQSVDKGFNLLPSIISDVAKRRKDVHFIVQIQPPNYAPQIGELETISTETRQIEFITGSLKHKDYQTLLERIDVFLLPYDPVRYKSSISGISHEAISMGKVVVAPAGSAVGSFVEKYQSKENLFSKWTSENVASCLAGVLDRLDERVEQARIGSQKFNAENNPDRFVEFVFAMATETPNTKDTFRRQIGKAGMYFNALLFLLKKFSGF